MINNIQPETIVKEKFDNAMYKFCKKLTHNSHKYYIETKMSYRPVYKSAGGKKYIKVKSFETATSRRNSTDNITILDRGSIHCFVNSENGDIYKPAGYKTPHLNGDYVRGNIFDPTTFESTDPHGGWLYHNSSFNQGTK
jgi:hypothetical protein